MAKVLIAENDLELKILYRAAIEFQRYEVVVEETIAETVKALKNVKPGLLVLDTNCNDFSKLEKEMICAPLLLLTDLPEKEAKQIADKFGAILTFNPLDGSLGKLIKEIRKVLPNDS